MEAGARSSAELAGIRVGSSGVLTIDLLLGAKPWQLLRKDATERQERPIAIGLTEGVPEPGGRSQRVALSRAGGGLVGTRRVAWWPSVLRSFSAQLAPIGQLQERRNPDFIDGPCEDRQG